MIKSTVPTDKRLIKKGQAATAETVSKDHPKLGLPNLVLSQLLLYVMPKILKVTVSICDLK